MEIQGGEPGEVVSSFWDQVEIRVPKNWGAMISQEDQIVCKQGIEISQNAKSHIVEEERDAIQAGGFFEVKVSSKASMSILSHGGGGVKEGGFLLWRFPFVVVFLVLFSFLS